MGKYIRQNRDAPPSGDMAASKDAEVSDSRPDEWKQARTTIGDVDSRLADLRKYGITFLSALMTAQGLITVSFGATGSYVTTSARLGIIAATMMLIITMAVMERINRSIQRAASVRAIVLERQLGLELTEDIQQLYTLNNVFDLLIVVYVGFVIAAGALGYFLLNQFSMNWAWQTITEIAISFGTLGIVIWVMWFPPTRLTDWSLDRYSCTKGDTLTLTFTNLSTFVIKRPFDTALWQLTTVGGGSVDAEPAKGRKASFGPNESWAWSIETKDRDAGTYELKVARVNRNQKPQQPDSSPPEPLVREGAKASTASKTEVDPEIARLPRKRTPKMPEYKVLFFDFRESLDVPIIVKEPAKHPHDMAIPDTTLIDRFREFWRHAVAPER